MMNRNTEASTEAEFRERLAALIREAEANGTDVAGGWPVLNGAEGPDWDVEIVEVRQDG